MRRFLINAGPPIIAGGFGWAITGNPYLGLTLLAATAAGKLIAAWRCRPSGVQP